MKRLLTILAILLLPLVCHAQQPEDNLPEPVQIAGLTVINIGGGVTAAEGCDPDNDEVGNRNIESGDIDLSGGFDYAFAATADCGDDLNTAYAYSTDVTPCGAVVCIYTKNGTSPSSSDLKVGCSAQFDSGSPAGFVSGAMSSGSVSGATEYWVTIFIESGCIWGGCKGTNTIKRFYRNSSGASYTTPPDNLGGAAFGDPGNYGPLSVYVTIGE